MRAPRRDCADVAKGTAHPHTLTQPSPGGRGLCHVGSFILLILPPRRLERPAPTVEDPRHRQRLIRRDLAGNHRLHGGIVARQNVGIRGQIELDGSTARARHQPVDDEPRRDLIAG